jgi:c-di-GMP-binding flagellar brake protein YcgR
MELEQIIRQIYRIPIKKEDGIAVTINGDDYEVVNLGSHGIGIRLSPPGHFEVSNQDHDVRLLLDGELLRLKGKIVHVTRHGADYLCGIKFSGLDELTQNKLLGCVYRIRARLFTKE